jgi:uncharacterized protein YjcR
MTGRPRTLDHAAIRSMRAQGDTFAKIADKLGCSVGTLTKTASRYGYKGQRTRRAGRAASPVSPLRYVPAPITLPRLQWSARP